MDIFVVFRNLFCASATDSYWWGTIVSRRPSSVLGQPPARAFWKVCWNDLYCVGL